LIKLNSRTSILRILAAMLVTMVTLGLGYSAFGMWVMILFSAGFFLGLIFWLTFPSFVDFKTLKIPYWSALAGFLIHRIEEKSYGFFDFLAAVTGVQTPAISSWDVILLVLISVGAWLSIPFFFKKDPEFRRYLAWTFFCSMGITELAHVLIFPFFTDRGSYYVPGMASVLFLAPLGWWGMAKLLKFRHN